MSVAINCHWVLLLDIGRNTLACLFMWGAVGFWVWKWWPMIGVGHRKKLGYINCFRLVKRKLPRNMTEHQISWQFFRCCMGWNKMVTDIYVVIDNIQQALKNTGSNTQNRFSIWWYTHNYAHTAIYILLIIFNYVHIHTHTLFSSTSV